MVQGSDRGDTDSGTVDEFELTKERADRFVADDEDLVITPAEEVGEPHEEPGK